MAIEITLSSANMGDVDETDFDVWTAFVGDRLQDALDLNGTVVLDQFRFGEAGEDRIVGATPEQKEAIRGWLSVTGWEAFCGEEWEKRRAAWLAAP